MATIGEILKHEIARLSRREIRKAVEPLRKAATTHRSDIAALKREIATLRKQLANQRRAVLPAIKPPKADAPLRFVAKGLRTLRDRFGMSAADFGLLVDIGGQTVLNWENKQTVPSREQVAKIAALRSLGKRDATARLDLLKAAEAGTSKSKAKTKPKPESKSKAKAKAKTKAAAKPRSPSSSNAGTRTRAIAKRRRKRG